MVYIDLNVIRNEKKYRIDQITKLRIIKMLEEIMKRDEYSKNESYKVRSLYFDTIYNKDYIEKKSGIEKRRKIRLRTYNENEDLVKLEIKEKINEVQRKESVLIKKNAALKLINGDYDVLRLIKSPIAKKIQYIMQLELYKPTCIIEYERTAFVLEENDTRITIDENIRSTESNFDLFSKKLMVNKVMEDIVLEVKYDRFLLSYIKDTLDYINKLDVSSSKYCIGRVLEWI